MGTEMWYLPIAMIALMYFMVLRPEQKRKKQQAELLSSIKQGDHVVTVGGLHGVVSRLTDRTVTIRVESVNLTYDRVAIARVERDDAGTPPAKT
ncbi:MAG: preprotein translocase subunit YajC [Planctomycetes bacterium]|nr:preprotein translocase subunit YajC [Planctomycetota bacterium]